jgi:hypothetical protein
VGFKFYLLELHAAFLAQTIQQETERKNPAEISNQNRKTGANTTSHADQTQPRLPGHNNQ